MADRSVRKDLPRALIIGACGNLGLAAARRMGQRYSLIVSDIDSNRLGVIAGQLGEEGIAARPAPCDVTDRRSVAEAVARATADGPIAALVHVAALSPSAEDWRKILSVDLVGPALMAEAVGAKMQGGVAVFISSLAAHLAKGLEPLHALLDDPLQPNIEDKIAAARDGKVTPGDAYTIAKYGLNRMTRRLAAPWGAKRNRIVTVSPGAIASDMGDREMASRPFIADIIKKTPLGREAGMLDIVDAVEFLCSDRAAFITGTDLLVDGGTGAALLG